MKKLLSMLLVLAFVVTAVSVTGCGGDTKPTGKAPEKKADEKKPG